jgi:hypothetical protein
VYALDVCQKHYYRLRAHGDPNAGRLPPGTPIAEKLAAYSEASESGCLVWMRGKTRDGYGQVRVGGKMRRAHVVAYELVNGPVPEGMELDHFVCDRRDCINPDHLRAVTHRENVLRSNAVGSVNAAKQECPQGHPYDKVNRKGHRLCSTCRNAWYRARYARQKNNCLDDLLLDDGFRWA